MKKIILVIIGSALLGLGAYLSQISQFGPDAFSFLWVGLSTKFNISMGEANLITSIIFLVTIYLIDKKYIHIGTLLSPLVISVVIDLLMSLNLNPQHIALRAIIFWVGILIYAYGIALYLYQDYGKSPYDGIIAVGVKVFKQPFIMTKLTLDAIFYVSAILLGAPSVWGPIVYVLFSGILIERFSSSKYMI